MRGQSMIAAAALVTALAAASPSFAQDRYPYQPQDSYRCEQMRNSRTAAGAVIGGILGAVVGSNVAADNARTEGSVLGGVAGAVAGGMIGRNASDCESERYAHEEPYNDPYRRDYGRDGELLGGPTPAGYGYPNQACGWHEVLVGHGRNRHVERVWLCEEQPRYGRY